MLIDIGTLSSTNTFSYDIYTVHDEKEKRNTKK